MAFEYSSPQKRSLRALLAYVSNQLRTLIKSAVENKKTSVELLVSPHLHSTSADAVLESIDDDVWKEFGRESLAVSTATRRIGECLEVTVRQPPVPAREYSVKISRYPEDAGVNLLFRVSWRDGDHSNGDT